MKLSPSQTFEILWQTDGYPELVAEHRFHPTRRWRFDYACPAAMVAIEIEGGVWQRGRHNRPQGYMEDCEKYLAATLLGWTVIRLTPNMIDTHRLEQIAHFIDKRKEGTDGTEAAHEPRDSQAIH